MQDLRRIIWLASYPKSGNTWTRVFLGNYLAPKGKSVSINELMSVTTTDIRQDWYDKAVGRPFRGEIFDDSIGLRPKIHRMIAAERAGPRFVKTHSKIDRIGPIELILPEVTLAAVYIMRNPFDVVPSYARHSQKSFDQMIDWLIDNKTITSSDTGIFEVLGSWDGHVRSWTDAPGLTKHVMRYEDMKADPERSFRRLLNFLQIKVQDGQLRRAIRASSFDALRKQEREQGFREKPKDMESFFARGRVGDWREVLSPIQVARIREACLPELERWYPELLDETSRIAEGA